MTFRFLERWGGTIATVRSEFKTGFFAEQTESADLGVAAVIRALGDDLGGYRRAGYVRAGVTRTELIVTGIANGRLGA